MSPNTKPAEYPTLHPKTQAVIEELLALGYMEVVRVLDDGRRVFRRTAAGTAALEHDRAITAQENAARDAATPGGVARRSQQQDTFLKINSSYGSAFYTLATAPTPPTFSEWLAQWCGEKRTLTKARAGLLERGWVEQREEHYHLTSAGREAAETVGWLTAGGDDLEQIDGVDL
jgi:DNA-binding PadR family transcriptional regulator